MLLYLIRHAHAEDGTPDAERPLSGRGRRQLRRLGKFFRAHDALAPTEIWHSPLRRARQTARRLAREAALEAPLLELAEVDPATPATRLVLAINRAGHGSLAVVGHEPQLGAVAARLLGWPRRHGFRLRKAAVLALERPLAGPWEVLWLVGPELAG